MKKSFKKYFIPSQENDHQPHSLRNKSLRNVLLASIFLEVIALVLILPVFSGKLEFLSAVLPSVLIAETNEERLNLSLSELKENDLLIAAAQMKANDMANRGYFSHITPEGRQPWYFLDQVGYQYDVAGENLAVNFVDSQQVHEAWMDSPTHRDNILKDKYTEVGIATAEGEYKGRKAIFVAQFFGKPKIIVEEILNKNDSVSTELSGTLPQVAGISVSQDDGSNFVIEEESKKIQNASNKEGRWFSNIFRKLYSSPVTFVSSVLAVLLILLSVALILKIFIKIKIQYPKMIFNSTLVMSVIASFYLLNSLLVDLFGEVL